MSVHAIMKLTQQREFHDSRLSVARIRHCFQPTLIVIELQIRKLFKISAGSALIKLYKVKYMCCLHSIVPSV